MRYTTTDGPKKPLNAIQEGSLGDKMGIAVNAVFDVEVTVEIVVFIRIALV